MCTAVTHSLLFFIFPSDGPQERAISALRPLGTTAALAIVWRASTRETARLRPALRCLFGAFVAITFATIYRLMYAPMIPAPWNHLYEPLVVVLVLVCIGLYLEESSVWVGSFWRVVLSSLMVMCSTFIVMQSLLSGYLPYLLQKPTADTHLLYVSADVGVIFALIIVMVRKIDQTSYFLPILAYSAFCLLMADTFTLLFDLIGQTLRVHWPLHVMNIALLARAADVYSRNRAERLHPTREHAISLGEWALWTFAPVLFVCTAFVAYSLASPGNRLALALLIAVTILHELVAVSDYWRVFSNLREARRQLQQALEQIEELAITRERHRLAREIHDGMGSHLHAAERLLHALGSPSQSEREQRVIAMLTCEIEHTQREMRRAISALNTDPADLSAENLVAGPVHDALVYGVQIDIRVCGETRPLSTVVRHTLYRVVQEAITNIGRHAHTDSGTITLDYSDPTALVVTIADSGVGMPDGAQRAGHGLANMRARVEALEGEFALLPCPKGVTLWFKLPI